MLPPIKLIPTCDLSDYSMRDWDSVYLRMTLTNNRNKIQCVLISLNCTMPNRKPGNNMAKALQLCSMAFSVHHTLFDCRRQVFLKSCSDLFQGESIDFHELSVTLLTRIEWGVRSHCSYRIGSRTEPSRVQPSHQQRQHQHSLSDLQRLEQAWCFWSRLSNESAESDWPASPMRCLKPPERHLWRSLVAYIPAEANVTHTSTHCAVCTVERKAVSSARDKWHYTV